jgi:predicted nicotinamide N-methyase
MAGAGIELVYEAIDLGGGVHARIARPLEPDRLLDAAVAEGAEAPPYWAELWPAGRALAAYVATLDLRGVRAVELGCGLALPAVAAALRGAHVLAVDHDADAVRLASLNGEQADGRVEGLRADLLVSPGAVLERGPFDLVLAADLLYDGELAVAVAGLMPALTVPGGHALVAYPWPRQADGLAGTLSGDGWTVEVGELALPNRAGARAIGLLDATRAPASEHGSRWARLAAP